MVFSCSIRHLSCSLRSLVSYWVENSKRNSISTRAHVLSSIFSYVHMWFLEQGWSVHENWCFIVIAWKTKVVVSKGTKFSVLWLTHLHFREYRNRERNNVPLFSSRWGHSPLGGLRNWIVRCTFNFFFKYLTWIIKQKLDNNSAIFLFKICLQQNLITICANFHMKKRTLLSYLHCLVQLLISKSPVNPHPSNVKLKRPNQWD